MPRASQAPGFVAGYWTRKDNEGLSMIVYESEDAARAVSEQIPSGVPEAVTLDEVEEWLTRPESRGESSD